jgi:hypothetical protein
MLAGHRFARVFCKTIKYSKTERVGVNAVERIVINDLGGIFREQPILDFGIDAQAELVEDGPFLGMAVSEFQFGQVVHRCDSSNELRVEGDLRLQHLGDRAVPLGVARDAQEFLLCDSRNLRA